MDSINKKSIINTIKIYLFSYRNVFHDRAFQNFIVLIIGIIAVQEIRSIKFVYEKFIRKFFVGSLNRFYYFMSEKNIDFTKIAINTIKIALSLVPKNIRTTIYLIVDDTLNSKFGSHFDCYYKLFDHTNKNGTSYINGHCFVTLAIAIPIMFNGKIRYLKLPLLIKLYDKTKSKLELASSMILSVSDALKGNQVIVLCDSWYTKKPFALPILKLKNFNIIGAIRSDTAMYELKPLPTKKRGRPKEKGDKIDYTKLNYTKIGEYYTCTIKTIINLVNTPVFVTITTTDILKFSSVRIYISTIDPENVYSFQERTSKKNNSEHLSQKSILNIYSMRWCIEVLFYECKSFWSFKKYMVRSKTSVESYVNMLGVAYSAVQLLPFLTESLSNLKFTSPQEIKYTISELIQNELILGKLLNLEQLSNNSKLKDTILNLLNFANRVS